MARISSLSSNTQLVKLMMKSQELLQDRQVQLATEKKSQVYSGISRNSERLINIESDRDLLANYSATNGLMDMRLDVTETVVEGIDDALSDFRRDLISFQATSQTGELDVRDVQNAAFSALQTMEAYLNTDVNGEYIFSGGRVSSKPVDLGLTTLSALQTKWNGSSVVYPTYRDNQVHPKMAASTGSPDNPTGAGYTNLTFTAGAGGTITTANKVKQVDTLTLTGSVGAAEAGDVYSATINGTTVSYTVTGAEADLAAVATGLAAAINANATTSAAVTAAGTGGGKLTLTSDTFGTPFTTKVSKVNNGAVNDSTISVANTTANVNAFGNIPVGAKITISGSSSSTNNGTFTVASNSGGVITVSSADTLAATTSETGITMTTDVSYYSGDELTQTHNVNKTRSFNVDLNGVDPAFEKAIRGLFLIAQGTFGTAGGLDQNTGRVDKALYLMESALDRNPGGTAPFGTELTSNLAQVAMDIGYDRILIDQTNTTNESLIAFYDNKIAEFEDADPLEVYTQLVDEQRALETSYQAVSRIRQLSLADYMQ